MTPAVEKLLEFVAGTETLVAEGRSLENQVILGGGGYCSVWGYMYKYVCGGAYTVLGCKKISVLSAPSLPVEMGY